MREPLDEVVAAPEVVDNTFRSEVTTVAENEEEEEEEEEEEGEENVMHLTSGCSTFTCSRRGLQHHQYIKSIKNTI